MNPLLRRRGAATSSCLIVAGLMACWLPTYLIGGAAKMPPLWFFVPILLAAVRFGVAGAIATALLSTLLAGPLTPGDVARHVAQEETDWVTRGAFFVGVGLVMASVTGRLQRESARHQVARMDAERASAELQRWAISDPRTGLANRKLLLDRLDQALARLGRRGGSLALLFIDLDDFKAINDSFGHQVGDTVLVAVGERLSAAVRQEDTIARQVAPGEAPGVGNGTIARFGGDEFVVLLEGLQEPQDVALVAERLLASLRAPVLIDGRELALDASLGITLTDSATGRGPTELLRDADTAMYAAKRTGRGGYQIFEAEMHRQVVARTELVRDLRSAVSERQLRVLYQPQIDLCTGRMCGVEALVRWQHPERGLLTPDAFLPVAESTGMIAAIDDWVLREACRQMRAWDHAGLAPISVAVNVLATRLMIGNLAETVIEVLRDTGADPARLEVELTETVAVEHDEDAIRTINRVRDLGVRVAIDDFGVGHSALSRLQSFPVDRLKIDRAFVTPLTHTGAEQSSIPAAMIAMAHSLDLLVVAEGIETEAQLAALQTLGCESGQGYLFSRPVPPREITRFEQEQTPVTQLVQNTSTSQSTTTKQGFVGVLLAELQRLTGLDSTYLTRVDLAYATQQITHCRNTGMLEITEGLTVDWHESVCRRALQQGINYTDDVPGVFPDSPAAAKMGLQTYITVPLTNGAGEIQGTLCGASRTRVPLGPDTVRVMETFAALIAQTRDSEDAALLADITGTEASDDVTAGTSGI